MSKSSVRTGEERQPGVCSPHLSVNGNLLNCWWHWDRQACLWDAFMESRTEAGWVSLPLWKALPFSFSVSPTGEPGPDHCQHRHTGLCSICESQILSLSLRLLSFPAVDCGVIGRSSTGRVSEIVCHSVCPQLCLWLWVTVWLCVCVSREREGAFRKF